MNRLMTCTTCNGEGRIQDRRENNRDEEEAFLDQYHEGENKKLEYIKKDWRKYSFQDSARYAFKIDYNEEAKELIADLRKLGTASGFAVRVRGSGPRAPQHRKDGKDLRRIYDQSLPLKYAEQVRIYIDHK